MDCTTLINKLKKNIANGRLVTICGTGISVAVCKNQELEGCKIATWPGLLLHGVKHCKDIGVADEKVAKLLTMQIESDEIDFLVGAAETISQRMKRKSDGVFRGWLKETVGKLVVTDSAVLNTLAALPGVLATLNYDNLIEDATDRRAVTWLKPDDVQDMLMGNHADAVLHLHGWYNEPESIVLGLSSYRTVKDHAHAKSVLNLLAIDRTILFVGCGDTVLDPNFTRLIEWGKEALKDVTPRHILLCRNSEIKEFQGKLAGAPWVTPLGYGSDFTDLAPFLRNLIPPGAKHAGPKLLTTVCPSFDINAYQHAMSKHYARLKLEELNPTTHDVQPLKLTGMFIAQSARECAELPPRIFELPKEVQRRLHKAGEIEDHKIDDKLLEKLLRAYLDQSPRPILEIIGDPALARIVVLGDPGSGKSTLLQYLLLQWAEKPSPDLTREPLPLLIELREYAQLRQEGKTDSFLSFLHCGTNVRWHLNQDELDTWLKNSPSLVLFDGLDEVFDHTLRREVSTSIHRFADTYPHARIIVTSRVIGYQHQAWRDEDFHHFMLQELDETQIAEFLARWHHDTYEGRTSGDAKLILLTRAIEDSYAIRQLAGNPLLLTMMAILNRTHDLPRDRNELYDQCARLLLHQWKVDVAFASDPELAKISLDFKDKRYLLQRVARAMLDNKKNFAANLIDEDTLEITLAEGLKDIPNLRPDRAARALIGQLRGRNFMLCAVGGRSYAFVHRTFLEYFCAVDIRERFEAEQTLTLEQLQTIIYRYWTDETWHEVLCLLAGLLAPRFVAQILDWLLIQYDKKKIHIFLAASCVGEVRKRNDLGAVADKVKRATKALVDYDLDYDERGQINLSDIRARAVSKVAVVWHDLDEIRVWLKDLACGRVLDGNVCKTAVQELVRGRKNDPETLAFLKTHFQHGWDRPVRLAVLDELVRGWKDDPETLAILKTIAQSDPDIRVLRSAAVEILTKEWKNDPETLTFLKVLAQTGENGCVCQTTAQDLAHRWQDEPEVQQKIKKLKV